MGEFDQHAAASQDDYRAVRDDYERRIERSCFGERYSPLAQLLQDFIRLSLRESAKLEEDEDQAQARAYDAFELASDFHSAVNPHGRDEEPNADADDKEKRAWRFKRAQLWHHHDPEPILEADDGAHIHTVDKSEVGDIAARYVQRPWLQYGRFEWMMFDALLYAEIVAFAVDWKARAPAYQGYGWFSTVMHKGNLRAMRKEAARKQMIWRAAEWAIGFVFPAIAIWNSAGKPWWYYPVLAWLCINVISKVIFWSRRLFVPRSPTPWEKGWALWDDMRQMYNALPTDSVVSPTVVRKEMDRLAEAGAIWPGAAYAIIDSVINRNPAAWVLNPRTDYRG